MGVWGGSFNTRSPVYIHLLRWLCGFVICNFCWHSQHYDEGYDPTGDIHRCVGLVHARVVRIASWDRRRGSRLHPSRRLVIFAGFLVQAILLVLAAEAQVARPATVPVVRIVALEHFVVLPAHIVVAQADFVVAGGRRLRGLRLDDRRDHGRFEVLSSPLFCFFAARSSTQHAQRVQVYK